MGTRYIRTPTGIIRYDNNFTDEQKDKLKNVEYGAQVNTILGIKGSNEIKYRIGYIEITKDNIGLGLVDNTPDKDKNVYSATKLTVGRNITIGNQTINFDGTKDIAYTLLEMGAVNRAGDTITGDLSIEGATKLKSTLNVTGATTLGSTLNVTNGVTLGSTLDVTGATTLKSTLNVTGATTLNSNLSVVGSTTLSDTLTGTIIVATTGFTGELTGNAATATKLKTARTINGTSFDGSADITTAKWGTSRIITLGVTGKNYDGSVNISWSLAEIGALPLTGGTMSGNLNFSNSNGAITWNNGTYHQRIQTIDDSTTNTNVFEFQQSSNSGSSFTTLFSIKDNGEAVASKFTGSFSGALTGNADTASKLATARTITLSGSVTGSASFDGSSNITITTTTNHTHNYAGSSSAGGVATSAYVLNKNSSFNDASTGRLSYYDADISNTTNNAAWSAPSSGWHQIYHNDLSVGGYWTELAFPVNDINGLAWRQRRNSSYYGWYRILDSNNYTNYTVTKTGSGASGTWNINVTGSAGSVSWNNVVGRPDSYNPSSHTHNYAGSTSAGGPANSLAGFTNTTTSATNVDNATQNGHVYVSGTSGIFSQNDGAVFVQAYSASWVAQIYQDYRTGQIALRGRNNGTWQAWRKVLDSSNYTDYTVTKTGSGASGTWGINISGTATNADKLDGYHGSSSQAANTYVLRDGNGYINTNYINSNTSNNENPTISQIIVTNGSDNYYRKASLAHFKSALGEMPPSSHSHDYLPLSGGTMTGDIQLENGIGILCVNNTNLGMKYGTKGSNSGLIIGDTTTSGNSSYLILGNDCYASKWINLGVSGSISSGDHKAVDGNTVYNKLPYINDDKSYNAGIHFYAPTSAGTDGYILKSNGSGAPSWVSQSSVMSNYLPLSGGTITGQIQKAGVSSSWVTGRTNAMIRQNSYTGYNPILSTKTTNGSWEFGPYVNNNMYLSYITDTNFNASNNTKTAEFIFCSDGLFSASTIKANNIHGGSILLSDSISAVGISLTGNVNASGNLAGNRLYSVDGKTETTTAAPNCYITTDGRYVRSSKTSSKRFKTDIKPIENDELVPDKLYNVDVIQFKYKEDHFSNENDIRYGKDMIGFIAEDIYDKYKIAADYHIDEDSGEVVVDGWNQQYMIPAMLKLIQEQHERILKLEEKLNNINA